MRLKDWTTFKSIVITGKNLNTQYVDAGDRYDIFAADDSITWETTIAKDSGADQTDFDSNYKTSANAALGAPNTSGTGTIVALNGAVTAATAGIGTVVFNVTGTWVATLIVEGSADGSAWISIQGYVPASTATTTSFSVNQAVVVNCGGWMKVRLRASAYTSGTVSVAYNASVGVNVIQVYNTAAQTFRVNANLNDGSNNLITSQISGGQRALDVGVTVGGAQIDPRSIRSLTSADTVSIQALSSSGITVNGSVSANINDGSGNATVSKSIYSNRRLLTSAASFNTESCTGNQLYLCNADAFNLPTAGTETVAVLLKNPNASGKTLSLRKMVVSLDATANSSATLKMYANPTTSANGSAVTVSSANIGGGAGAAVATPFTGPTVSANGTRLMVFDVGSGTSISPWIFDFDGTIALSANNTILFTGNPSANNTTVSITLFWIEL